MFIDLPSRGERATSLTEMLFTVAIGSLVLAALLSFTLYAGKSFAAITNYVELEQRSQNSLDTLTREIRQAKCLTNFGTRVIQGQTVTNSLTFLDSDDQFLTFIYTNDVLLRIKGGQTSMLLTNCDYLCFQIYQRNTIPNQYDQYNAGSIATCKQISVNWICSRSILGTKMNTESVQTAKVVIRNQ